MRVGDNVGETGAPTSVTGGATVLLDWGAYQPTT